MKILRRLLLVATMVLGTAVALPTAAQAAPSCSLVKGVPGISITYSFCDAVNLTSQFIVHAEMVNNHGADITLETQMYIRVDGGTSKPWLAVRGFFIHTGVSYFDPYTGVGTLR